MGYYVQFYSIKTKYILHAGWRFIYNMLSLLFFAFVSLAFSVFGPEAAGGLEEARDKKPFSESDDLLGDP